MLKENCSLIGYISKPHGKGGDLNIRMNGYDAEIIEPGESLFVEIDETLVPFFIQEITPKGNIAVMHLDFIDSVDEAVKFSGKNIYLLSSAIPAKPEIKITGPASYKGFSFTDLNSGIQGIIKEYIDNPANPLFLVSTATQEFLIPAHPDIIINVDVRKKTITSKLPEGLADF